MMICGRALRGISHRVILSPFAALRAGSAKEPCLRMGSFASLRMTNVLAAGVVMLCAAPTARAVAQEDVPPVIEKFKAKDPGMAKIFSDAVGYVVFPTVGKGGIGLGGARGKGWVYEGGHIIGKSTLTQVSFGFQFGGQAYSEIVFFQTTQAMENFKLGHLKFDAQASAIALTARASADLAYRNGVAIVTMAKGGLMYEASVGGQKFSFKPVGKK
jgi:lipid-binding SYLF domain-containing protein